jgi:plastocyanin
MPASRWLVRAALIAAALLLVAGCGDTGPAPAAALPDEVGPVATDPTVAVRDNLFAPEELVVEVGTEVTWDWEGRSAHDVVGDGFKSEIAVEGTFTHTFTAEGAYDYVCTLHPGMEATVYVVPEGH